MTMRREHWVEELVPQMGLNDHWTHFNADRMSYSLHLSEKYYI